MLIRTANERDIKIIHELAIQTWWPTYRDILPEEQISFMLEDMYSEHALKQQMENGLVFLLVERDDQPVAFAGFSLEYPDEGIFKLHKIYILPSEQSKGTGKKLIQHIIALSKAKGGKILELNVNRNNPALSFYKKLGFELYKEADIPYYEYVLNDFILRKSIDDPQL